MDATELNKHLSWAERLCSRRECCPCEVQTKLKAKGVEPSEAGRIVATLVERNFLNEERYIRAFVHDKSRLQGWGPAKIRYALRAKQLSDPLINKTLAAVDQGEQKEKLRRLLKAKQRSVKAISETDLQAKLIRFGLVRGFSYEAVVEEVKNSFL